MARRDSARIRLSVQRRKEFVAALQGYFDDEFGDPLSEFRAEALTDFFIKQLGAGIYNQGVRDAVAHMQLRLNDVEGEVYEREG